MNKKCKAATYLSGVLNLVHQIERVCTVEQQFARHVFTRR